MLAKVTVSSRNQRAASASPEAGPAGMNALAQSRVRRASGGAVNRSAFPVPAHLAPDPGPLTPHHVWHPRSPLPTEVAVCTEDSFWTSLHNPVQ